MKRYELLHDDDENQYAWMYVSPEGEWAKHSDVKDLERQNAVMREALKEIAKMPDGRQMCFAREEAQDALKQAGE